MGETSQAKSEPVQRRPRPLVLSYAHPQAAAAADGGSRGAPKLGRTINVVWGCGGWGGTQVLAEIARGGWGIVTVEQYLAIRPDTELEMDWLLDFDWNRIVPLAKVAPQTEYTRRRRR